MIREEVLNMVPELREKILEKPKDKKIESDTQIPCYVCLGELHIPCYFDPSQEIYICSSCEAQSKEITPLIKIRDENLVSNENSLFAIIGMIRPEELKHKKEDNEELHLTEKRNVIQAHIKNNYQRLIMDAKKRKQE